MKKILIVDDSKTYQKIIEKILSPNFEIVGMGSSGIEGIELYQKLRPDLVLLDITMPNCSGKECLEKIMQVNPEAKVIMVSSIGDEKTVLECLQMGAKAFVNKAEISQGDGSPSPLHRSVELILNPSSEQVAA